MCLTGKGLTFIPATFNMEFVIRTKKFDMCIRTSSFYSIVYDKFLPCGINIRVNSWVWSTGKGLRKLANS